MFVIYVLHHSMTNVSLQREVLPTITGGPEEGEADDEVRKVLPTALLI